MARDGLTVRWLRPGDRLVLGCLCGAVTTLGRGDLILLLGAAAPLDFIGLRARCARCGQPPSDGSSDWQRNQETRASRTRGAGVAQPGRSSSSSAR
jgi:hypothetical protein